MIQSHYSYSNDLILGIKITRQSLSINGYILKCYIIFYVNCFNDFGNTIIISLTTITYKQYYYSFI